MSYNVINPNQTFRDSTGAVRANGTVTFYVNTTTTLGSIYSDEALTVAQSNPYTLDAFGRITGDVKYSGLMTVQEANEDGSDIVTNDNVASMETSGLLRSDLASTATYTPGGGLGFELVYFQPLGSETGVVCYFYKYGNFLRYIPVALHANILAGTNTTDLTAYKQNQIASCATYGFPMYDPAGTYRLSDNLYFYGDFDIIGDSRESTIWEVNLTAGAGEDNNKYHIVFGGASFGGSANAWNGVISKIQFKTTALAIFERLLFFINTDRAVIQDCWWNFLSTTFTTTPAAASAGGPISSGANATWFTSSSIGTIKLLNNRVDLLHKQNASEGLGLTSCSLAVIDGNEIYGVWDDAAAVHTSTNAYITNNKITSITGRCLIDHVEKGVVDNNHMTRIAEPVTGTWYEAAFIETIMSSSSTTRVANLDITITNNKMTAPSGAVVSYWIRARHTQLALDCSYNSFNNESSLATGKAISVEAGVPTGAGASWTGPVGNPDEATSGVVRIRNVTIVGNKDIGPELTGGFQQVGTSTDFLEGFLIDNNNLPIYSVYAAISQFTRNNVAKTELLNITLSSCQDTDDIVYTFTGLDNTYQTGSRLTATPVPGVFRSRYTGRIMGATFSSDQVGTSSQIASTEILINGSSATSFNISVGTLTQSIASFTATAGMDIVVGDLITVKVWCSSGQLVALTGSVIVHLMADNY